METLPVPPIELDTPEARALWAQCQAEADAILATVPPAQRARFTAAQRRVERLGDAAMLAAGPVVEPAILRRAILAATSPEDLEDRLAALIGDAPPETFAAALTQALFAADVLGYVTASAEAASAAPVATAHE